MRLLIKLIIRDAWYHRGRISLAALATIGMSCMIVWLVGNVDLMIVKFDQDAENYMGHYQLALIPERNEFIAQNEKPTLPVQDKHNLEKDLSQSGCNINHN
ncbi:MAG: hypothetical protein ACRC2T_06745, partial [Thermoguttaceae bacterium]